MEEIIINLIISSGEARSKAMEAIGAAKRGDIDLAKKLLKDCEEALTTAHGVQTKLIQNEANGEKTEISLLVIHAQDHLMTAMVVKDLAIEIVDLHESIRK